MLCWNSASDVGRDIRHHQTIYIFFKSHALAATGCNRHIVWNSSQWSQGHVQFTVFFEHGPNPIAQSSWCISTRQGQTVWLWSKNNLYLEIAQTSQLQPLEFWQHLHTWSRWSSHAPKTFSIGTSRPSMPFICSEILGNLSFQHLRSFKLFNSLSSFLFLLTETCQSDILLLSIVNHHEHTESLYMGVSINGKILLKLMI